MPRLKPALLNSLLVACGWSGSVNAQTVAPPTPDTPSAPHERLRFFEGTWTTTESTAEDGFRERCTWLPEGRRHMVCRSRWQTSAGPREGMSVFSFDPAAARYIYTGFRSGGRVVVLDGDEQGGRWVFASEEGAGALRVRTRVTIEANKDQGFDFSSERSTGDGPWIAVSKLTYRRVAE